MTRSRGSKERKDPHQGDERKVPFTICFEKLTKQESAASSANIPSLLITRPSWLCSWCRAQTDRRHARRVAASQSAERRAEEPPCATWPPAQIRLDGSNRISLVENVAHKVRPSELMKISISIQPKRCEQPDVRNSRRIVRPPIAVASQVTRANEKGINDDPRTSQSASARLHI